MVQNAKMKNIGKMLLSWAAVIVLVAAIVIFTIVKGTAFFFCGKPSEHSSCNVRCYDFCSCCNSIYGSGRI